MERRVREKLREELQALRPVLLTEPSHRYVDLFDEFIEHHEFGLALETVCDYILEPASPRVSESIIDLIQRLHSSMEMSDECVVMLRNQKLA